MNKKQGFILKPETYNQKEWYELFMNLSKEYRKKCNIIKELSKDVDMWNKKYNEQFNIINELEKWAKEELEHPNWASCGARCMLDKLKELKENK